MSKIIDYDVRTALIGETGTGKTYLASNLLRASPYPVLITDLKYDIPKSNGWYEFPEENTSNPKWVRQFVTNHLNGNSKVIMRGSINKSNKQSQDAIVPLIREYLRQLEFMKIKSGSTKPVKYINICIDEFDIYHGTEIKSTDECIEIINRLFSKGRSVGAIGWLASQRCSAIDKFPLTQCQQTVLLYQKDWDLSLIKKYTKADPTKLQFDYENDKHRFYIQRAKSTEYSKPMRLS